MKPIRINLASNEYVDLKLAYIMIGSAFFLLLILTAANIFMYSSSHEQLAFYEDKIEKSEQAKNKKEAGGSTKMSVNEKEIEITRTNTLFVNRIIGKDVFPWERVLNAFETNLPEDIYLESFKPDEDFNKIILKGYAASMSEVSTYLKEKEGTDLFKTITLVHINVEQAADEKETPAPKPPVQFEIESTLNLQQLFPVKKYGEIWRAMLPNQKDT